MLSIFTWSHYSWERVEVSPLTRPPISSRSSASPTPWAGYSAAGSQTFPESVLLWSTSSLFSQVSCSLYDDFNHSKRVIYISGILFPVLLTLRHNTYSVFLAVSAMMGLSIAPLPTVTSGVITNILGADKLNDAFGEDNVVTKW